MNAELKVALAEASDVWRKEIHASCPKCRRMAEALAQRKKTAQCNLSHEVAEALLELHQFMEKP